VIGSAIKAMQIATGDESEELETTDRAKSAASLGARGGKACATK
jgi:hypothetical protein